jgi:hypothetical protein
MSHICHVEPQGGIVPRPVKMCEVEEEDRVQEPVGAAGSESESSREAARPGLARLSCTAIVW